MNEVLEKFMGLFCSVRIDDILNDSRTEEGHDKHLT